VVEGRKMRRLNRFDLYRSFERAQQCGDVRICSRPQSVSKVYVEDLDDTASVEDSAAAAADLCNQCQSENIWRGVAYGYVW
jgi:hypothetical protein